MTGDDEARAGPAEAPGAQGTRVPAHAPSRIKATLGYQSSMGEISTRVLNVTRLTTLELFLINAKCELILKTVDTSRWPREGVGWGIGRRQESGWAAEVKPLLSVVRI